MAVGVGGDAFVVTADGVVRSVTGFGEQAVLEEAGSLGAELSDAASLTVVGDTLVAFDQGTVRTVDRAVELAGVDGAVLQQPSASAPEVLLASGGALWRVPLGGGSPSAVDVPSGSPARPVQLDGCAYGLWARSGYYVRDCKDAELNEAAQIDGASRSQQLRYILLPMVRPVLSIVLLLQLIWDLRVFAQIRILQDAGAPVAETNLLGNFIYELGMGRHDFGAASAVSLFVLALTIFISWPYIRVLLKEDQS